MSIVTDRAINEAAKWDARYGDTAAITINFSTTQAGKVFEATVYRPNGSVVVTLSEANGKIVNNGTNIVITLDGANAIITPDTYEWKLRSDSNFTWFCAPFELHNAAWGGTTSSSVDVTVDVGGTSVDLEITIAGSGSFSDLTGVPGDNAALAAALALKLDSTITYKTEADDHTLDADDLTDINAGKDVIFLMSKSSGSTFTLPQDSVLAVGVGKKFRVRRTHASGLVTVAAGSGATASGSYGDLLDPGLNVDFEIQKVSANTWFVLNGSSGAWVSHTPTFTGFSVQPTGVDCTYFMLGKKAFVFRWDMASAGGTSNSGGFSMTMPFLARSRTRYPVFALNNGTFISTAQAYVEPGSNVIDFYIGVGSFTASGGKASFGQIIVEIQ